MHHQSSDMTIRMLLPEDASAYQEIRLRGLAECPTAFSASYEDELDTPISTVAELLAPRAGRATFGFHADGLLRGVISIQQESVRKLAHKASVVGMYVAPENRLKGVGYSLLSHALTYASRHLRVQIVTLGVNIMNTGAVALYERAGFRTYGTEHGFLKVDGVLHDQHRMSYMVPNAA